MKAGIAFSDHSDAARAGREAASRAVALSGPPRLAIVFTTDAYPPQAVLEAVRDLKKVAHYLHVPAQSGCDEVLKLMKRGYTIAEYRDMMQRIREIVPDCSVSSDFIVGHPGETEESFEKSLDLIREFRFKNSFIFKYSKREGTKADDLFADDIPDDVKRRRNNEMLDLQNEISEEDNAEFIGRTVAVLVEGPSRTAVQRAAREQDASEAGELISPEPPALQLMGRSECDRIVVFDGNPRLTGSVARIRIDDCTSTTLIGSIETREIQHGSTGGLPILV